MKLKIKLLPLATLALVGSAAIPLSLVSCKGNSQPEVIDCTVTINLDGGFLNGQTGTITKVVPSGTQFSQLGEPIKNNCDFAGWLKDGALVSPLDTIDGDISIKATWQSATIVQKNAKFFNMRTDEYLGYEESSVKLNIYLINDGQIPYVKITDLFDSAMGPEGTFYDFQKINNVFTIKNLITSKEGSSKTCTFDVDNQTITFIDYDSFIWYYTMYKENPLASGCGGGESWEYDRVDDYTSGGVFKIELNKYNISIYSDNDNCYIPYDFCYNIFDYDLAFVDHYWSDSYVFVRNNFYEILDQNNGFDDPDERCYCSYLWDEICEKENIDSTDLVFNSEYREYAYNLLALTLDTRFGMTTRPSRSSPEEVIEYFPDGALTALEPYHNDFVSTDANVANNAMINIMKDLCDDGGHAGYIGCDVNTYNEWAWTPETVVGPEYAHTIEVMGWMSEARKNAGHDLPEKDPEKHKKYDSYIEVLSSSGDKQDIAWVTFDSFLDSEYAFTYSDVNASNYMYYGTVGMTMYLQKLVNTPGSTIDKIVIDLSNNGGGYVFTEHILASYLCGRDNTSEPRAANLSNGGVTHTIWNPHSKAFSKYTYYADINEDGDYNQDDYLPEGVQVYCIVSDASFSCGNMLPSHLKDCSTCKFIGSQSGGGACYVDGDMHIGLGNVFRSSSNMHSLKNASTHLNPITVDEGVVADFYHIPCDDQHAIDFFDRNTIIEYIMSN